MMIYSGGAAARLKTLRGFAGEAGAFCGQQRGGTACLPQLLFPTAICRAFATKAGSRRALS